MPSILNATTVNGIAVSGDNSGVLALQTNNGTTAVTIDTSQNVGIGTTSPVSSGGYTALTLNNATNSGYVVLQTNGTTTSDWYVSGGTTATFRGVNVPLALTATGANFISASTNGTERMRIDSSGNVGIGTNSPTYPLHIVKNAGGSQKVWFSNNNGGSSAETAFSVSNGTVEGSFRVAGTAYAGYGAYTANNTVLYNDTSAVTIMADNASNGIIKFATGGNSERMRITSAGNLEFASGAGILQLATNQTMRVPSTGGIGYVGNINSSTVFQIAYNSTSAGVQLSSGATSWGTFSDSRLKNITGTYTNALNDIAQIQPVKFTWKSDEDNKPQVGVVAQSVENVVPEAVDSTTIEMDGTEKYLTVRYTELIPLMIASIQELKAIVDTQAAEIAALKGVK